MLRVPLDAQEEGIIRGVYGLGHFVRGVAADFQPGCHVLDGLMVHAVHRDGRVLFPPESGRGECPG